MIDFKRNITRPQSVQHGLYQLLDNFAGRDKGFKWTASSRKKYYAQLYEQLKSKGKGQVYEIDRVKDISAEEFKRRYLFANKPVIFDGAAKDWACVKEWSLDYFIERHGSDHITVVGEIEMNELGGIERKNYTSVLSKELTDIKNGGSNYYKFYPLMNWHPEHLADVDGKWLRSHADRTAFLPTYQVFIGAAKSFTNLHNSLGSNLFTQVVGEKEWYLYPVYYTPVFDPSPTDGMSRGAPVRTKAGPFDPFNPNYEHPYQLFEYLDSYHMILKPGDVFYNPPYYWHCVRNLSISIGMGYRWLSPSSIIRSSNLYSFLDCCSKFWISLYQAHNDINILHQEESKKFDDKKGERK